MMMTGGEPYSPNPTVHVPPWSLLSNDPSDELLLLHHRGRDLDCDEFRMYEFKVRRCARVRAHDWTECPYAHPGEKARRRDPRKYHYCSTPCPDFRKGNCTRGENCECAHGVFECWLHPARYRTQPCRDGTSCLRRICFFAHTPEQLRVVTPLGSYFSLSSPTSTLMFSPPFDSPPVSPDCSVNDLMFSMRKLGINTQWNDEYEEPVMERVESGRNLRAKMFERLSKENSFNRVDSDLVM